MNKKHFYPAVILLLFLAVGIQPAFAATWVIGPDQEPPVIPPGTIGTWIEGTRTFTLAGNTPFGDNIEIIDDNLTLDGAGHSVTSTLPGPTYPNTTGINLPLGITGVTVKNVTVEGFMYGIYLYSSDVNFICNNILSNNGSPSDGGGIRLNQSDYNIIKGNSISGNYNGLVIISSNENEIYNNNFIENSSRHVYVYAYTVSDNTFNLPLPRGGNYWSGWTGPDLVAPFGIVDNPYVIRDSFNNIRGRDYLPWVLQNGWPTPTPEQAIEQLIAKVAEVNGEHGINNSLDAKLQNALDALTAKNAGQRQDAVNKMQAFINAVESQSGKKIPVEMADELIADAQNIIDMILAE